MSRFTVHAAKTHLSKLIARAQAGEEVVISRGREPVARLVPIPPRPRGRAFGAMRGKARVDEAFFAPLAGEELDAWDQ